MKKDVNNITDHFTDNTLTEWSIAVRSPNLNQEYGYATGKTAGRALGYVAGFGFGSIPVSAWIERLKRSIKT